MKLYDNAFSPFARRVRLVLDHKGLAYEAIDALEPGTHETLAAVNPRVEVPVLDDDGLLVVNGRHRRVPRPSLPGQPGAAGRSGANSCSNRLQQPT